MILVEHYDIEDVVTMLDFVLSENSGEEKQEGLVRRRGPSASKQARTETLRVPIQTAGPLYLPCKWVQSVLPDLFAGSRDSEVTQTYGDGKGKGENEGKRKKGFGVW